MKGTPIMFDTVNIEFDKYSDELQVRLREDHKQASIRVTDNTKQQQRGETECIWLIGDPAVARRIASSLIEVAEKMEGNEPLDVLVGRPKRGFSVMAEQARTIFDHMGRAGTISAREAQADHDITSATLARRICDIEEAGYVIIRERKKHPISGRRYTRYSLNLNAEVN